MARPKNSVPVPFLRQRKNAWQIRWTYDGEEYAMSIGAATKEEAKIICATAAIALAAKDDWPPDLVTMPAVKRYLAKKSGNEIHSDDKALIEQYAQHMRTNSRSNWYVSVRAHLKNASEFTGNLLSTNPAVLTDFLDAIHGTKSTATRNRAFASLSGFYRWLRLKRIMPKGHNPLEEITMLQEEHIPGGIIIWERDEIPKLLKAADALKDGIAVWIAIYAGLRRGELVLQLQIDVTRYLSVHGSFCESTKRLVKRALGTIG